MVACSHYNPSLFFFRPGLLATSASNYPWLADSWPATNLLRNGKPKEAAVSCCPGAHNPSERYYNGKRFNIYFGVCLLIKWDLIHHNKISLLILNIEHCPQTTRNRYFFLNSKSQLIKFQAVYNKWPKCWPACGHIRELMTYNHL